MKNALGILCAITAFYSVAAWASERNQPSPFQSIEDPYDYTSFAMAANVTPPVQRVDVVNMLWNPNATGGAAGLTQTPVTVNFFDANSTTKPCTSSTLPFQGAATVLAGAGQPCLTRVLTVSFVPQASAAGVVFDGNSATVTLDATAYSTQLIISDGGDPVFDSTNGSVKTPGVVGVVHQQQFE